MIFASATVAMPHRSAAILPLLVSLMSQLLLATAPSRAQCGTPNTTTAAGEWADYDAYYNWGFIWLNAARIRFDTREAGEGRLRLKCTGVTHPKYDYFFPVRDTFECIVRAENLKPVTFHQACYEGKTTTLADYRYGADSVWSTARQRHKGKETLTRCDTLWNGCTADVLTMVYQCRNIDFKKYRTGDKIPFSMIINALHYGLYLRYKGSESVTTRNGRTYNCLKFTPLLVDGTIFTGGEDMTVWVTDDERRVPVLIEAKVLIGSVKAMLADYGY